MTTTVPETTDQTGGARPEIPFDQVDEVLAELLVEEISIDGMCGVY